MMAPTCILCDEPVENLRRAVPILPGVAHHECALRSVVGGIGHHEDHSYWCLNVGDSDGGRTYRQSALEVAERYDAGTLQPGGNDE